MRKYLLLLFVFLVHAISYANDDCANAIQITPSAACNYTNGNFAGMTLSGGVPGCATTSSQDVWYQFTATSETMSVSVERSSFNWDMYFALEIYEDSCTGNVFNCMPSRLNSNGYYNNDFTIGRTYFLRILNAAGAISALNFRLCVQDYPKPANDLCANATVLTPTSECNYIAGSFSGAMLNSTAPTCATTASQDVWYQFTATSETMSLLVERSSFNWDMYFALEIYEDSCAGSVFKCSPSRLNSNGYYNNDFTIGRTYFLRVLNASGAINALNFRLCLQAYPKPANDLCANATVLSPTSECNYIAGSFSGAMLNSAVTTCATTASQDIWYQFTATSETMSLLVERSSFNWDMYFALEIYEDSCAGNVFKCSPSRLNSNGYYNNDFTIGRTYFLRVLNSAGAISALNFRLCLQAYPKPANDFCANATTLIPTSECNYIAGSFSGAMLNSTAPTCATTASQDVWYQFTATSETMSLLVERSSFNWDMYFALEIYEDSCTGSVFKCGPSRLNSNGYYNNDFTIGRTYFLRVVNAAGAISALNFRLCLQAYPKPANDLCANATTLIPTSECNYIAGSFSGAMLNSTAPTCATTASQDVWYQFTATSETMSVYVERTSFNWDMYFALEIYEDSCTGNLFRCRPSQLNSNNYYNNDFMVGKTYFLRILNASSSINTFSFKLCVQALPRPANDLCANAAELIPANNCTPVSGTFSGALLEGTAATCPPNASQDVWYKFTATSQTMSVFVERASFNWTMFFGIEIYGGNCAGNQLYCGGAAQNSASYQGNNLTIGNTYYLRLVNASATINSFGFRICLTGPPPVTCTPSIAVTASAASICQGGSVVFTASSINGGTAPSYQWKVNGNSVGTNSPTFATTSLTSGSTVSCVLTSSATCASPAMVESNTISVSVSIPVTPAFATVAPICAGTAFTLPSTSANGITGVWSPPANNIETTTYIFTPNPGQCASTTSLAVEVISPNATVTVQGNTITALATNATYQWINCSTSQPIAGATAASYMATANGSYAVIVTQNGCSKTSTCASVSTLGMDAFTKNGWTIYPNPATEQLFIELTEAAQMTIIDANGKTIRKEHLKAGTNVLTVSSLTAGVYFLKSSSGATVRFVKR